MSDIETTISQAYDPEDIQVFGINAGESLSTARNFVESFGLTYPVLWDADQTVYYDYWVNGLSPFPRDVIIDRSGVVRYLHSEYDTQYMLQVIEELIAGSPTSIPQTDLRHPPASFRLRAYPNPFNPVINIEFVAPAREQVVLSIFDMTGRRIIKDTVNPSAAGDQITLSFDLSGHASGTYMLRIDNSTYTQQQKISLIK